MFLNFGPQNFGGLQNFSSAFQLRQIMWTKVQRKSKLNFKIWSPNNVFASELWLGKIWQLVVARLKDFSKTSKYVDQSLPISRKSESLTMFDQPQLFLNFVLFWNFIVFLSATQNCKNMQTKVHQFREIRNQIFKSIAK